MFETLDWLYFCKFQNLKKGFLCEDIKISQLS